MPVGNPVANGGLHVTIAALAFDKLFRLPQTFMEEEKFVVRVVFDDVHIFMDRLQQLRGLGIPASEVASPCRLLQTNPQLQARGYFETPEHPVVGAMPLPSLPFRYASVESWLRTPAPTVGQHNEQVLCGVLGLSPDEISDLEARGVIGTRPEGL